MEYKRDRRVREIRGRDCKEGIDGLLGFSQGATLIGEMLKRSSSDTANTPEGEESDADEEFTIRGVDIGHAEQSGREIEEQMRSNNSNSNSIEKTIGASIPTLRDTANKTGDTP